MLHDGYLTTGIELRQRCRKSQFEYRYGAWDSIQINFKEVRSIWRTFELHWDRFIVSEIWAAFEPDYDTSLNQGMSQVSLSLNQDMNEVWISLNQNMNQDSTNGTSCIKFETDLKLWAEYRYEVRTYVRYLFCSFRIIF